MKALLVGIIVLAAVFLCIAGVIAVIWLFAHFAYFVGPWAILIIMFIIAAYTIGRAILEDN